MAESIYTDDDPYTGEVFESRDHRDGGKRVRVTGIDTRSGKYILETISSPSAPWNLGRVSRATQTTLVKYYRKVSR